MNDEGTMYHVAPVELREIIERDGLLPHPVSARWGPAMKNQPVGLYVFDQPATARDFAAVYGGDVWSVEARVAHPDPGMNYPGSFYLEGPHPATLFATSEELATKCIRCGEQERAISSRWCVSCMAVS